MKKLTEEEIRAGAMKYMESWLTRKDVNPLSRPDMDSFLAGVKFAMENSKKGKWVHFSVIDVELGRIKKGDRIGYCAACNVMKQGFGKRKLYVEKVTGYKIEVVDEDGEYWEVLTAYENPTKSKEIG